jgi:hypothetical protein
MKQQRVLIAVWVAASTWPLFAQAEGLLLQWPISSPPPAEMRAAGGAAIAKLDAASAESVARAKAAGFSGVSYEAFGEEAAVRAFASKHPDVAHFVYLKPEQMEWRMEPAHAVLGDAMWPGRERQDTSTASATATPWINSNAWRVAWLRAKFPGRKALIGLPAPEKDGVANLALAVADAWSAGGNSIIPAPDGLAERLRKGEPRAAAGWRELLEVLRFMNRWRTVLEQPVGSRVCVLAGGFEAVGEILNMLFRRDATPAVSGEDAGGLRTGRHKVAVTAGAPGGAEGKQRVLEFVRQGGVLLASPLAAGDGPWWPAAEVRKVKGEEEREVLALGKGQVVAYKDPVLDPAEFALDVLEAVGWEARDLRSWHSGTVIGLLRRSTEGKTALLLVNYGTPPVDGPLVRVEGEFMKAAQYMPESEAGFSLAPKKRGSGVEIDVRSFNRLALIVME